MKLVTCFLFIAFVAMSLRNARQGEAGDIKSCGFRVEGSPAQVTVTGPDDIVPLVYVVEQPDSPIEIASLELGGTWLSVSDKQYRQKTCAAYKIRNRSDRTISTFDVGLVVNGVSGGTGLGAGSPSPLLPGQVVEVKSCNGGGSGGAPGNHVRLLASVSAVDFGDCFYRPSARIPRSLGIIPNW